MQVVPSFFDKAEDLRGHFDDRVEAKRTGREDRFIWDYWHIPGQYTYFRTLAEKVVPSVLLGEFTSALSSWGAANLGTDKVTPTWLSFYTDGCRQELHSDVVQGTWSFVFSLTRWEDRAFTGGETMLATRQLLDYWTTFDPRRSIEAVSLVERIPALFNQLCVFDSRYPHGVSTVDGTRDPVRARVAMHGWFQQPLASCEGGLDLDATEDERAKIAIHWHECQSRLGSFMGHATWRIHIDSSGKANDVVLLVENLVSAGSGRPRVKELLVETEAFIRSLRFARSEVPSSLLLPLHAIGI